MRKLWFYLKWYHHYNIHQLSNIMQLQLLICKPKPLLCHFNNFILFSFHRPFSFMCLISTLIRNSGDSGSDKSCSESCNFMWLKSKWQVNMFVLAKHLAVGTPKIHSLALQVWGLERPDMRFEKVCVSEHCFKTLSVSA